MKNNRNTLSSRIRSFTHALNGLKVLFRNEPNARIHLVALIVVVTAGFYFDLTAYEWLAIVFSVGFVFAAELFNTSIENMADFMTAEQNPEIKIIKDLAAAAVLVSALTAIVVGLIVFVPKLLA
jgi:diacylglycerol kinase